MSNFKLKTIMEKEKVMEVFNRNHEARKAMECEEIQIIKSWLISIGGSYSWVDDDGEELKERPIVVAYPYSHGHPSDVYINKAYLCDNAVVMFEAIEVEDGWDSFEIDCSDISLGQLQYIYEYAECY